MRKLFLGVLFFPLFAYNQISSFNKDVLYFRDLSTVSELMEIGQKIKPSFTKYEYYKHLYEVKLLENYSSILSKSFSKNIVFQAVNKVVNTLPSFNLENINFKDQFNDISPLEQIVNLDSIQSTEETDVFFESLRIFLNGGSSLPAVQILTSETGYFNKDFICIESSDFSQSSVNRYYYEIIDNGLIYRDLSNHLNKSDERKLYSELEKIAGKSCLLVTWNAKNLSKSGNVYEIEMDLCKSNESVNSPMFSIKYKAEDFYNLLHNSIMFKHNGKWISIKNYKK